MDGRLALAPIEELAHQRLGLPLPARQPLAGQGIRRIAGPAAGEIAADDPVVAAAGRENFGAVVDLRRAAHGGEVGQGQFKQAVVFAKLAVEAADVVVVAENHQGVGVRIEPVVDQHGVEGAQALGELLLVRQGGGQHGLQGEIHNARQPGLVAAGLVAAALPVGDDQGVGGPFLADDVEARKFLHHPPRPLRHERLAGIGVGVHAHPGQAKPLDPPDGVLDEVFGQQRIVLIEIRHVRHEPAVVEDPAVGLGGVGVQAQGFGVAGFHIAVPAMHPVFAGRIRHPPVMQAAVIDDHVHDEADAPFAPRLGQGGQLLVAAEAGIHAVEIRGGVAVVGILRHGVFQHRIEPDGGEAQPGDVVQALPQALQVAAVAGARQGAIHQVAQAGHLIVARVAIGEAVRRDEVDGVRRGEALGMGGVGIARVQAIAVAQASLAIAEADAERAGLRLRADAKVQKQVVRIAGGGGLLQGHPRLFDGWLEPGNAFPVNQQLQLRVLEAQPPGRRLHPLDRGGRGRAGPKPASQRQKNARQGRLACPLAPHHASRSAMPARPRRSRQTRPAWYAKPSWPVLHVQLRTNRTATAAAIMASPASSRA